MTDDASVAAGGPATGIDANGCIIEMHDSSVVGNTGTGINLSGGSSLTAVNSSIGGNAINVVALKIGNSYASLLYSTVLGAFGNAAMAVECDLNSTVTIRNSMSMIRFHGHP